MVSVKKRFFSGLATSSLMILGGLLSSSINAHAAPINISYNLTSAAKVSLNIYDSSGNIVRELLHTAGRTSGTKTETWDGRDDAGNPLPAGNYTWKVLGTPGFGATYITSPGANYTLDNTAPFWAQSPGSHGGPSTVAVDASGFYVSAYTENIEAAVIKQTLTGTSRVWSNKALVAWDAPNSLAVAGTSLWERYQNGTIYRQDTATGADLGNISTTYGGENPSDMTANATSVIVCYSTAGLVRWLDYTGAETRSVSVAGVKTVDVASDGTVYVISGTDLRKITPTGTTSTVLVSGLVAPRRAAVNPTNGAIYVIQNGASQQVKRFSSAGALLNTYGVAGGRVDGDYQSQKTSFRGATDIAVESNGNFWVAEAESAPRRVARFTAAGAWSKEYYGGQAWAPFIMPEPDNLNYVWIASAWGDIMRCQINYASKTWSVQSTYHYQGMADGLIQGHDNGANWEARVVGGTLYICRVVASPQVYRVDRVNSKLIPVVQAIPDVGSYAPAMPAWFNTMAATNGAASALWTDANGDGRPLNADGSIQTNEFQFFSTSAPYGNASVTDKDLNYIYYRDGQGIKKFVVTGYNAVGSPIYGNYPNVTSFGSVPSRMTGLNDDRWSAFLTGDANGGVWGAFNPNTTGWGTSDDAFVARWDSTGALKWQSGHKGFGPGNTRTFRRVYGVINNGTGSDCTVVTPFSSEWVAEGVTPVYVYDQDGLYAGQLIGQPLNTSVASWKYSLGAEALSGSINKDASGNVYFYGHWISEGRIYKITGWNGWQRKNGSVTVPTGYTNPAFTPEVVGPNGTGTGLYAQYWVSDYSDDLGFHGEPVISRAEAAPDNAGIDFLYNNNGDATNSPTGTPYWSARWTGTITPRRTGWHMFYNARGTGSPNQIFVNNINVCPATMDGVWGHDGWSRAGRAVYLVAGTSYPIKFEYATYPANPQGVKLQWAEPETNGLFTNVPTSQLVPVAPTPVPTPTPTPAA